MKEFGLKFIDIMIGIVLGLGFQWWPNLHEPWQYAAFIFVYFDIVDYWIDYSPSLKKFPPKNELSLLIDVGIMFTLFLYIYTTQLTIVHFLAAFMALSILDLLWMWRARREYQPHHADKIYLDAWLRFNAVDAVFASTLIGLAWLFPISAPIVFIAFVVFRIIIRILASYQYKKMHFA